MRVLDLFCGAGGAAMGYHQAGFEVVGVDIKNQRNFPFEFHKADALGFPLEGFDLIHASPPCQAYSITGNLARAQGNKQSEIDLVEPTRQRLIESGIPYIIENVMGAPLIDPIMLCGSSFGLKVRRHRLFESSFPLTSLSCDHKGQGRPVGVYGSKNDDIPQGGRTARTLEEGQEAMGIDWMPWSNLVLSIPPAYTKFIGEQAKEYLTNHKQYAIL